jgi:hypothetical protein
MAPYKVHCHFLFVVVHFVPFAWEVGSLVTGKSGWELGWRLVRGYGGSSGLLQFGVSQYEQTPRLQIYGNDCLPLALQAKFHQKVSLMNDHYLYLHEIFFIIMWVNGPALVLYFFILLILFRKTCNMPYALIRGLFFVVSSLLFIPIIAGLAWKIFPQLHTTGLMPEPGFPIYLPSYVSLFGGIVGLVN